MFSDERLESSLRRLKGLREELKELRDVHGCSELKLGTEGEACTYEEIGLVNKFAQGIVPVVVKIGGVDARSDMRRLLHTGVGGIIAPMVESPYGIRNFTSALRRLAGQERFNSLLKIVQVESVNGYRNFDKIVEASVASGVQQVTVGMGDLSRSVNKTVEDPDVVAMAGKMVEKARTAGLLTAVGGGVRRQTAKGLVERTRPDKLLATPFLYLDVRRCPDVAEAIGRGLSFGPSLLSTVLEREVALLDLEERRVKSRRELLLRRVEEVKGGLRRLREIANR